MNRHPLDLAPAAEASDPLAVDAGDAAVPKPSNRLSPVEESDEAWSREYLTRWRSHLYVTDGSLARMVSRPSFSAESCLSVYAKTTEEKQEFFITATTAAESLWYSMAANNEEEKTREVKVSRADRKISRELADAIHALWSKVLLESRDESGAGLDGTTTEFSAEIEGHGLLAGETWSPCTGLMQELVSTGHTLMDFAKDSAATEEPVLKEVKALAERISAP